MSISTTAISVSFLHHRIRAPIPVSIPIPIPKPCTFSRATPTPTSSSHSLCLAASFSSSNSGENEDSRWLREEQRWLREEQRWLREEARWISERESLLREISMLRLRLQQLESELQLRNSLSDSLSQIASVSETTISLPTPRSESLALPSSSSPPLPAVIEQPDPTAKETIEEVDRSKHAKATNLRRKTLKVGSEGEEVRLMQEALLDLGFYSGEDDMEYMAFSSGTDLAVRTWQSSIGAPEDGIMTDELLQRLYSSQLTDESDPLSNSNGAALVSITESPEIQQTIVKKEEKSNTDLYQNRVYLLGENRWEEPSRVGVKKVEGSPINCIVCRGEGRIMCAECDGSGEPNIEPQFLEWVEEAAICPYCDGVGFTPCDTCDGTLTA
ncbi:hypothetical protein V2J09_014376 [Rumex salicifolius]